MADLVAVTFAPDGPVVNVEAGTLLIEAARAAGLVIAAPCGGRGTCGGCAVRVVSGDLSGADEVESAALQRAPRGVRLACRARVTGPVCVEPVFGRPTDAVTLEVPEDHSLAARHGTVVGVDLGTTTVAALLVDGASGRPIARAGVANAQAAYGADVLSRLSAAIDGRSDGLRRAAEESVALAIERAAVQGHVDPGGVDRCVIAANTAMAALFVGADVNGLAVHPFTVPVLPENLAATAGLDRWLAPGTRLTLVPPLAGFVGGDALAAMIAGGLADAKEPQLLLDIGTNAEIVLATADKVVVASAAAGTAFEGAGISCGGPATPEAVARVAFEEDAVVLTTVGDASPRWLSGAGFTSAVAMLRSLGHVTAEGTMTADGPLKARFTRDGDGVVQVVLSGEGEPPIFLTQLDVRALQLAKGAVRVGIETVLLRAGVLAAEVVSVAIAGAFGAALDPSDLRALGVIPPSMAKRVSRIGNAALDGAAAMALDPGLFSIAAEIATRVEHVDLASDPGFAVRFMAATALEPGE